jgi:hypothetical protein
MALTLFNVAFFKPRKISRRLLRTSGVTNPVRLRFANFEKENPRRRSRRDLPFSFPMSSKVTLLLRTPGDPERQLKKYTPPCALQRISRHRAGARGCCGSYPSHQNAQEVAGNTLNRRTDSFSSRAGCALALRMSFFLNAVSRKPKPHSDFQLPAATFPLRACGRGNFFEQKIQLAGPEQIEWCARNSTGVCWNAERRAPHADIRAQIRGVRRQR